MDFQHLLFVFCHLYSTDLCGSRLPERIKRICFLAWRKNYSPVF